MLAPTAGDGPTTLEVLKGAGFEAALCRSIYDLCQRLEQPCGAVLIAEEALFSSSSAVFLQTLARQPAWSDLPVLVVTSGGTLNRLTRVVLQEARRVCNLSMLERPFRTDTLVSLVEGALRARRRQYQVRDLLVEQERLQTESSRQLAELRTSEENLRAALDREAARALELKTLMDAAPTPVWISTDPEAGNITGNPASYALLGMPPGSNVSLNPSAPQPPPYRAFKEGRELMPEELPMQRAARSGQPVSNEELEVHCADGTTRTLLINASPLLNAKRRVKGVVATAVDITERREMMATLRDRERELEQLNIRLEQEVDARTARLNETIQELESFSYSITHDLRAPLRTMQSFCDVLIEEADPYLTPECKDYLKRIANASRRMDSLIRDVLAYSRVLRTDLELRPINLQALIEAIVESYPNLQPDRVQLSIEGEFCPVLGNEAALTQCVSNLLNNAVKFVAPGVFPRVRIVGEKRENRLRIWFEDNGIGIDPAYQDRIFTLFQRISKNYEGTGLGLSIVRKAAERMGGTVGVQSEPGQGSRFWVELNCLEKTDEQSG